MDIIKSLLKAKIKKIKEINKNLYFVFLVHVIIYLNDC